MASIVEKEQERIGIVRSSSRFTSRLRQGMLLQTDQQVIYSMGGI